MNYFDYVNHLHGSIFGTREPKLPPVFPVAGETMCNTPGRMIRSRGMGRGLARGRGRGPRGVPYRKEFGR